jgi:hypothetical protein
VLQLITEHLKAAPRSPVHCRDFPIISMSSAWQPHSLGLLRRLNGGSYIPGPAPDAAGNEDDDVKMSFVSVLKVGQSGSTLRHLRQLLTSTDSGHSSPHLPHPLSYYLICLGADMEAVSRTVQHVPTIRHDFHSDHNLATKNWRCSDQTIAPFHLEDRLRARWLCSERTRRE